MKTNTKYAGGGLLADVLIWLLLFAAMFRFPNYPVLELDASWRMALGWFFERNLQWGTDVVFTYGPLGFLMGKTYWGEQFWWLVGWQIVQGVLFSSIFLQFGRRLAGMQRFFYFAFVVLFGVIYEDALHMIMIAVLATGLLDSVEEKRQGGVAANSTLLAVLAAIKFTNLLFAGFAVAIAAGVALARRRRAQAAGPVLFFSGTYLVIWLLCGQSLLGIPSYLINSLDVSIGYEAMSLPTPGAPFVTALIVAALMAASALIYFINHRDPVRGGASVLIVAALLFLNWKHGFVRADGHMIGFFICALLPIVGSAVMMPDPRGRRALQLALLVPAGLLSVVGIEQALSGVVRGATSNLQGGIWDRVYNVIHWTSYRGSFDDRLRDQIVAAAMPRTKAVVGDSSIDVLGFEQAVALFNHFNYTSRPVFQSYSAYTPRLAALNAEFYASDRAPDFALLRLQTLDERPLSMDDAPLLNYFLHAYQYIHTEKSWQLWRRKHSAPSLESVLPRRVGTESLKVGQSLDLSTRSSAPLWVTIDLRPSALGSMRGFLYKLPIVTLALTDTEGTTEEYRLPLRLGRTGFIVNPHIENIVDLMDMAGGEPRRRVASLRVEVPEDSSKYFRARAEVGLFSVTASDAGLRYFSQQDRERYWMFSVVPLTAGAFVPTSEIQIDGRAALVFHAPSEAVFEIPAEATRASGSFGFAAGAYGPEAFTNGAEFLVLWTDGMKETVLFSRFLDPKNVVTDRGLKDFSVAIPNTPGGRIMLRTSEGPNGDKGWDWTAWTNIKIE